MGDNSYHGSDRVLASAMPTEWWVMRVWTRWVDGVRYVVLLADCSAAVQVAVNVGIAAGSVAILPGGIVAEPIECYVGADGQVNAHARREYESKQYPMEDFRVVMNVDA